MVSPKQYFLLGFATLIIALVSYFLGYGAATLHFPLTTSPNLDDRHLHVLVPITSRGHHLCRLLISSGIAGYPDPVFVGWNGSGIYDGAKTHLFKITESLVYLDGLPESMDDDLVLMLDALDIQLQLRPEILISRYYDLIEKSNARLKEQGIYGKTHRGAEVKQTIVFGPDKSCSPQHGERAACWAIPDSPLPPDWAGPHTDAFTFADRAHYLNSGTILGPVRDVRDLFRASLDMISWESPDDGSRTSDQWYFGEVWGEQEVERTLLRDGNDSALLLPASVNRSRIIPYPHPGKRTEYHITLDYETAIFQTASGFDRYITWMSYNHASPLPPSSSSSSLANPPRHQAPLDPPPLRIDQYELPADIAASRPPFARIAAQLPAAEAARGWRDVMLGTSVWTAAPFPLIHVTALKMLRDRWWRYMWFHPHAEALLRAEKAARLGGGRRGEEGGEEDGDVFATVRGVKWREVPERLVLLDQHTRELENLTRSDDTDLGGGVAEPTVLGGAWTSHGLFLPFDELCGDWTQMLYNDYHDWEQD